MCVRSLADLDTEETDSSTREKSRDPPCHLPSKMPVVSEPTTGLSHTYTYGLLSNISTPYLLLSLFIFLCITIFIRRKRSATAKLQYHFPPSRPSTPLLEDPDLNGFPYEKNDAGIESTAPPTYPQAFSRPPPPPPFTQSSPLEPLTFSPINGLPTSTPTEDSLPRREIISGDGWRRHTRVFGGGVCEACAESERRMSA
ncbi:hypothetical protein EYC84_011007 [Monilinia fructicola]|uniref:Uncharacterized protein n=1 Tax=Monilinia fructicola TaxID=38448 RepID=A0A5M9J6Z6_MONFR|nr:hypothetical protein EYC84_011007 [Monilinia fructicola]